MDYMFLYQWFHEYPMTLNPRKCQYRVIGSKDPSHKIMLNNMKCLVLMKEKYSSKCPNQVKQRP